jgi:hypothetical protein
MATKQKQGEGQYATRFPGAKKVQQAGDWFEWEREGQEVVGVFKGMESFRNGFKTTIATDKGPVIFSTPKLLKAQLDSIEIGQGVAIVYAGEGKDTGKGNPLKEFEVYLLPGK